MHNAEVMQLYWQAGTINEEILRRMTRPRDSSSDVTTWQFNNKDFAASW